MTVRRRRVVAIGIFLVAIAVTAVTVGSLTSSFQLGSITVTESLLSISRPIVERDAAVAAGLEKLGDVNPAVQGLSLANAHFAPGVRRASSADGQMLFTTTDPLDAWVLDFVAPAQNSYSIVRALVIVDARTGVVSSAQLGQTR